VELASTKFAPKSIQICPPAPAIFLRNPWRSRSIAPQWRRGAACAPLRVRPRRKRQPGPARHQLPDQRPHRFLIHRRARHSPCRPRHNLRLRLPLDRLCRIPWDGLLRQRPTVPKASSANRAAAAEALRNFLSSFAIICILPSESCFNEVGILSRKWEFFGVRQCHQLYRDSTAAFSALGITQLTRQVGLLPVCSSFARNRPATRL